MAKPNIEVEVGESTNAETVHFTGGLRGVPTKRGWALFPISGDPRSNALLFRDCQSHFQFATQVCGLRFIGSCVHYVLDKNSPPMDVWESGPRDPSNQLRAADSWGAVAHQAATDGNDQYADSATNVAVCLKVSELRLRDVSNRYHDQLKWALHSGNEPGSWFSNMALLDLYADCHSLVTEMSSARDYLARLAAIHAGAPDRIDSLARLEEWVSKASNRASSTEPLIHLLLSVSGTKERPGWLRRLGDIRNQMLHTLPMGANSGVSSLTIEMVSTPHGLIHSIRLGDHSHKGPLASQQPDPLVELSAISSRFEQLSRAAWKMARYPALLPVISDEDVK